MLDNQTMNWLLNLSKDWVEILDVKALLGGVSSYMYQVDVKNKRQETEQYVLRQIRDKAWLGQEKNLLDYERSALRIANKLAISTPRFIAYDVQGKICPYPSLLMSKLEGIPKHLKSGLENGLFQMAQLLVKVHGLQGKSDFTRPYEPYV